MIRFICVVVFLILFLILTIPVFFIEWLIGKFNRNARDYSCLRIVQWGFKAILKVTGVHTTVIGFENIPDEPVLFIGNTCDFGINVFDNAVCGYPHIFDRESVRQEKCCQKQQNQCNAVHKENTPHKLRIVDGKMDFVHN